MASKVISNDKKWAAALRVLREGRTAGDEARRLSVSPKSVQNWVRQYLAAHPEADLRKKAPPPPPPLKPEHQALALKIADKAEDMAVQALKPEEKPGLIDAEAVKRAMEADGAVKTPPQLPAPPTLAPLALSTELEDMAIVEGAGNQVLGAICRIMIFLWERKAGVTVEVGPRLQRLFVLTDPEKAMLKPASKPLAAKLREWIGSDEKIAYAVGGSTLGQGLVDRAREIGQAIADAARVKAAAQKDGPKK